jgi:glutathionylspermidine synthase
VKLGGITVEDTPGRYENGRFVYQQYMDLAPQGSQRVVLGSWLVDGVPCGIGIREPDGHVTSNVSRFVPHLFH